MVAAAVTAVAVATEDSGAAAAEDSGAEGAADGGGETAGDWLRAHHVTCRAVSLPPPSRTTTNRATTIC